MSKAPSVEESLDDVHAPKVGRKIAKNLHVTIFVIVIGLLGTVVLIKSFQQEAVNNESAELEEQRRMRESARVSDPVPEALLAAEMASQRRQAAEWEAMRNPEVPAIDISGPPQNMSAELPPVPQGAPVQNNEDLMKQQQKLEAARASTLLAVSRSPSRNTEQGQPPPSRLDQMREQQEVAMRDAQRAREELLRVAQGGSRNAAPQSQGGAMLAAGGQRPQPGQPAPRSDEQWQNEVATSSNTKPPIKMDAPNRGPLIHQGSVIPAALVTEINSDLPGQISAVVTMDVYDTVRGDHLLIPRGSRLIGGYNTDVRPGQERVMAAFTRLIRPDGSSMDLAGMGGADGMGQAGMTDEVDTHFWKMFTSSLLIAGVAWLADRDQPDTVVINSTGTQNANQPGQMTGEILSDVSRTVLERNRAIPVTLRIRHGHKFNVIVNRDMQLSPYAQR